MQFIMQVKQYFDTLLKNALQIKFNTYISQKSANNYYVYYVTWSNSIMGVGIKLTGYSFKCVYSTRNQEDWGRNCWNLSLEPH